MYVCESMYVCVIGNLKNKQILKGSMEGGANSLPLDPHSLPFPPQYATGMHAYESAINLVERSFVLAFKFNFIMTCNTTYN